MRDGYPDPSLFAFDDKVCLMSRETFDSLQDYTRAQPTGPKPGRVYKKNLHWTGPPDNWFVYVCELDPDDPTFVLHQGRSVLFLDDKETLDGLPPVQRG